MKKLSSLVLLVLMVCNTTNAQLWIPNPKVLEDLKTSTTYVVIGNEKNKNAQAYIDVIKDAWTLSKLEFITINEMPKYYIEGNSFMTLTLTNAIFTSSGTYGSYYNSNYANTSLEIWFCDKKWIKNHKEGDAPKRDIIAELSLQYVPGGTGDWSSLFIDMYREGKDWPPNQWVQGFAKNYVQWISIALEEKKMRFAGYPVLNKEQLAGLKNDTLYIPKWVVKQNPQNNLLEDYKHPVKIINDLELSNKILAADKPFYYAITVRAASSLTLSVLNAKTGEAVFIKNHTGISGGLENEFKDLNKAIGK